MPQSQLPIFPDGVTAINANLAFVNEDGVITYLHGHLPVFSHPERDVRTFRMITSQLYVNGNVTQAEILRAFGVPASSVKRAVKLYRTKGAAGFYAPPRTRGPAVLTPSVLAQAQQRFDAGCSTAQVASELGLKRNTLTKAVRDGRLQEFYLS